ncbi:MAG: hypothetical protein GXO31_08165 [Epsilonproteobacteria bacterium]|nr:hypothetical protein [Campylobacterota bacterium]
MKIVLYIHILAATAWIGGSLLLFALGILLRDKNAQKSVYFYLGPIYGYFETFWLVILWISGLSMFIHYDFISVFTHGGGSELYYLMRDKLVMIVAITILTALHMYIAFKTHNQERTKIEQLLSRGSSMLIFILNLFILWFAIGIRDIL